MQHEIAIALSKIVVYNPDMKTVSPSGGQRKDAGRPHEFDALYQLRHKSTDRKAWERKAKLEEKILSDWMRDTLNAASKK